MLALALILAFSITSFGVMLLPEELLWTRRRAFFAVSWLPCAIAIGGIVQTVLIRESLGYLLILIVVLAFLLSFVLLIAGVRILLVAKQRSEPYAAIIGTTLLAALPLVAIVGYLLIHAITLKLT